jgi:hypothetical protein
VQVEGHVLDGRLVLGRQVLDLEDHLFGLVGFSGKRWVSSRPTIMPMI